MGVEGHRDYADLLAVPAFRGLIFELIAEFLNDAPALLDRGRCVRTLLPEAGEDLWMNTVIASAITDLARGRAWVEGVPPLHDQIWHGVIAARHDRYVASNIPVMKVGTQFAGVLTSELRMVLKGWEVNSRSRPSRQETLLVATLEGQFRRFRIGLTIPTCIGVSVSIGIIAEDGDDVCPIDLNELLNCGVLLRRMDLAEVAQVTACVSRLMRVGQSFVAAPTA